MHCERERKCGHAVVIGSGFVGLATSYYLRQQGWKVTCLERRESVALETSFQNGGLLCPGLTNPWSNWSALKLLISGLNPFSSSTTISMDMGLLTNREFLYW